MGLELSRDGTRGFGCGCDENRSVAKPAGLEKTHPRQIRRFEILYFYLSCFKYFYFLKYYYLQWICSVRFWSTDLAGQKYMGFVSI